MNRPSFDASSDPTPDHAAEAKSCSGREDVRTSRQREIQSPDALENQRPFLGIHFKCCKTYGRIYRNRDRYVYEGRCPKCRGVLTVPIGPEGTDSRFLSAQ